jgi:hypothetical protein
MKNTDNLGATDDEVMDSLREDVASAFKICHQQRARIAALESELVAAKRPYEFLNETFLQLMNDIGRIGHERFGADAIEVAGGKRKIERHQKNAILVHVAEHLVDYKLGIPHDKLGTLQAHLGAAAFNCMLEFVFSKGEE